MAEGLQPLDEIPREPLLVKVVEIVLTQIMVVSSGGQQAMGNEKDGVADRDNGSSFTSPTHDTAVEILETRAGLFVGSSPSRLRENTTQPAVAVARLAVLACTGAFAVAWIQSSPRRQVRARGKLRHVRTDFGQNRLGDADVDPGNRIQQFNAILERGNERLRPRSLVFPRGRHLLTGLRRIDRVARTYRVDVRFDFAHQDFKRLQMAQVFAHHEAMVSVNPSLERLAQLLGLGAQPAPGQFSQGLRVLRPFYYRRQDRAHAAAANG